MHPAASHPRGIDMLTGTNQGIKMTPNIFLTIPTKKIEESLKFYTTILGFTLTRRLERPGGVVLLFSPRVNS